MVFAVALAATAFGEAAAQDAGSAQEVNKPGYPGAIAPRSGLHSIRPRSVVSPAASAEIEPVDGEASRSFHARESDGLGRPQLLAGGATAADLEEKRALIERYFRATNLRATTVNMVWSMSQAAGPPVPLTADERPIYDEVVTEVAAATFDRIAVEFTDIYAEAFTLEELQGLVDFYESPVGQSLMAKTTELAGRSAEIVPRMNAFFSETLRARLCARIDCVPPAVIVVPSL